MKKTSVILFSIDKYFDLLERMIESFNCTQAIDKFYVLSYDNQQKCQLSNVININLAQYNYDVNKCYNEIKHNSEIWLIWKPTYFFNQTKKQCFESLIDLICQSKYQICFIFGIKLYYDCLHVKNGNEYSCRNGGCFLMSNKVNLKEGEIYFSVDKANHKVNYNLYNDDEYYFFDVSIANSSRIMLLNDFESMYVLYLRCNPYMNFIMWYEMNYNSMMLGEVYVKKKYKFDGRGVMTKHNYILPKFKKTKCLSMTYLIIISTTDDITRLYHTLNSIRSYSTLIILNGNFSQFALNHTSNIKIIQLSHPMSLDDCNDIAINNISDDIITILKAGAIVLKNATQLIIDAYDSEIDNVFVYPTILDNSILSSSSNDYNKIFVSFKKKYYSKFRSNCATNCNLNLLLKLETTCMRISLENIIEISNCNICEETQIEKYDRLQLVINCIESRYSNCNIYVTQQIVYSNGIKIAPINEYAILNKNILNVFFDKVYCTFQNLEFNSKKIQYEIIDCDDALILDKCYKQKLFSILIVKSDAHFDVELNEIKNIPLSCDKIIFNKDVIGYILNNESSKNNCYYVKNNIENINKFVIFNPYPKVTVIMSVYNKEQYLESAISSVLRQSYKNLELIIVEDCSTDNSREILNKFTKFKNIKIILNEKNLGCYSSRNIGISNSTGTIIGFQDADDYTLHTRIEKQVNLLTSKNLLMVGCNMIRSHIPNINYNDDNTILKDVELSIKHFDRDCCTEIFGYPTLLIKKELFDLYGKYIERQKGMDMEFPERVMFKKLGIKFKTNSWDFFDKGSNEIYEKLEELLVISPDMNELNITNSIKTDDFLQNKLWRNSYV